MPRLTGRTGGSGTGWTVVLAVFSCLGLFFATEAKGAASADTAGEPRSESARAKVPLAEIKGVPLPVPRPVRALEDQPEVQQLCETAAELIEDGEYDRAVDRLDEALNLAQGDYYELPFLMAKAKAARGEFGEARTFAELAAQLRPGGADVHYLLGRLYQGQGQIETARAHFRTATLAAKAEADNPRVTAAWYRLGECLEAEGYLSAACEAYAWFDEAVFEDHPAHQLEPEVAGLLENHPHGMLEKRLELLRRLGRLEDATRLVEAALSHWPDEVRFERLYVRTLLEAGRAEEALAFCRTRLDLGGPGTGAPAWPVMRLAVSAARAAGMLQAWVNDVVQALEAGRETDFAGRLADRLVEAGEGQAAVRIWQKLLALNPDDADAAWALALALRSGEAASLSSAVEVLTEFVQKHPDATWVPQRRLEAWLQPGALGTEAVGWIREQADSLAEPSFARAGVLAGLAAAASEMDLAETLFKRALADRPGFPLARIAWAQACLDRYRWSEARRSAEALLEDHPHASTAHFLLAEALAGLDENDAAEEHYRAAIKQESQETAYLAALGRFYRRRNNLLAAQRYLQEAAQRDPTDGGVVEDLIESYIAGGKVEIARRQWRELERHDVPEDAMRRIRTTLRFADRLFQEEHLEELQRQWRAHPGDVETGLKLAAGLYVGGRDEEAFPVVQRIHAEHPDNERAVTLLARLHARRLEFDRAAELLESLARRYPNRRETLALLVDNYLAAFREDEARHVLEHLLSLELAPEARKVYRNRLLLSYTEFGEYGAALEQLEAWLAESPEDDELVRDKLRTLLLADRADEALELATSRLEAVTAEFRSGLERFQDLVSRLRERPDDEALAAEAEALRGELERGEQEVLLRRVEFVQVAMDARRFEAVEQRVRAWLEATPDEGQYTQWLVMALLEDGRPEEAIEILKRFQPATPLAEAATRTWLARAEAAAGRVDKATAELEALLEEATLPMNSPPREEVWDALIQICLEAERYDQALEYCRRWAEEGSSADAQSARRQRCRCESVVLGAAGREEEYLERLETLHAFEPDDPGLNNDLGYTWVEAGRNLTEATRMIRRAVAADPLRAAYLDSLGWAYYKAGDYQAAETYLGRAARLRDGRDPVIYDHWGDVAYRRGEHVAARERWELALKLLSEQRDGGMQRPKKLRESLEAKLSALEQGGEPPVAPPAAEP